MAALSSDDTSKPENPHPDALQPGKVSPDHGNGSSLLPDTPIVGNAFEGPGSSLSTVEPEVQPVVEPTTEPAVESAADLVVPAASAVTPVSAVIAPTAAPTAPASASAASPQRRVVSETDNRSNQKVRLDDKLFEGMPASSNFDKARVARSASTPFPSRQRGVEAAPVDPVKKQRDELVMDTNKSSIVSKRSVEKLYYPNEPEYFRYFVSKFKRRSPLINRGYWLRMKAIEHAVTRFLSERTAKRKVVVNLGCGYDPLPFLFLGRQAELCHNTTFVDVDHPVLMQNKMAIIERTEQLRVLLPKLTKTGAPDGILGSSDPYVAVGCDLINTEPLRQILHDHLQLAGDPAAILFVSEVSTAYMERDDSQTVFQFAASYDDVRFVLLEQHLPDGADHPFAQTMLAHFEKLRTPLRAIGRMDQMKLRFVTAGFPEGGVDIRSLWELWSDPTFLSAEQRRALDRVEPFDEWEEFALFGSHYFLLVAEKEPGQDYGHKSSRANRATLMAGSSRRASIISSMSGAPDAPQYHFGPEDTLQTHELLEPHNFRRFGAILGPNNLADESNTVGLHGGLGTQERLDSCNTYSCETDSPAIDGPPLRTGLMCHTITSLGSTANSVLVGGRTSPDKASAECWLRLDGKWKRVHNLPTGRYRHCAVPLVLPTQPRPAHTLLVFGGKTSEGHVLDEWLIWTGETGWCSVKIVGETPPARFGACMITDSREGVSGVLVGGMTSAGRVLNDFWYWSLEGDMTLVCRNVTSRATAFLKSDAFLLGRFGAQLVWSNRGILMIGGITGARMLTRQDEILNMKSLRPQPIQGPRPLFIGFSVLAVDGGLIVLGGGATCFSFGTTWNRSCMLNEALPNSLFKMSWRLLCTQEATPPTEEQNTILGETPATAHPSQTSMPFLRSLPDPVKVQEMLMSRGINFAQYAETGRPLVLKKCDLGLCTTKWTTAYLKEAVGNDRVVSVHVATDEKMDFKNKNFEYKNQPFGEFLDAAEQGQKLYLRALSHDAPADKPTTLADDFPSIAEDFQLPPELASVVQPSQHSSPLRISSGAVRMWLHYDVMANIYCQVKGRKRLILFPPADVNALGFEPGASSSALDINTSRDAALTTTHPHEAVLEPGDVLFLPPMWVHTSAMTTASIASSASSDFSIINNSAANSSGTPSASSSLKKPASPLPPLSIAVNIFFRNMAQQQYAAGRDVYGNRDLAPYERGRKDIARIIKSFDDLPTEVAGFYLERLAAEMLEKAKSMSRNASLHSVYAELS